MTKLFVVVSTILFITSCYHENKPLVNIPDTILPKGEMVNILTDIYVAEGTIAYRKTKKEFTQEMSTRYYKQIFKKHNINHRILKDNLRYYNSTPEIMEDIMEEVLANLSRLQSEVMAIETINDTVSDAKADFLWNYLTDNPVKGIFYDSILQIEIDTIFNIIHNYNFRDLKDTVSENRVH